MKLGQGRNDARNGSERSRTGRKGVGKGPGMDQLQERVLEVFCRTREQGPLVQCITNFVTVNDCANVILAAGGSPSMAHDIREAAEAVEGAAALVCNMGAIENIDAMILAGQRANALGKPVILDPVAAGGTELRRRESRRLLEEVHFSIIRGNASELRYLAGRQAAGSGVDAGGADRVTEENLLRAAEEFRELSRRIGSVTAVSGEIDLISDGNQTAVFRGGCPVMARITGSGCMQTALLGAFSGAGREDSFAAACAGAAVMNVCGELADEKRKRNGTGNATFRTDLIDAVFNLTEEQLKEGMRYEIFQG